MNPAGSGILSCSRMPDVPVTVQTLLVGPNTSLLTSMVEPWRVCCLSKTWTYPRNFGVSSSRHDIRTRKGTGLWGQSPPKKIFLGRHSVHDTQAHEWPRRMTVHSIKMKGQEWKLSWNKLLTVHFLRIFKSVSFGMPHIDGKSQRIGSGQKRRKKCHTSVGKLPSCRNISMSDSRDFCWEK